MQKIQVTLDVSKLKNQSIERTYKNRDGETVTVKELKFELVPVKEPKVIYDGEKHQMVKTHFAALVQTKEQRAAKEPSVFIGDGFTTVWKNEQPVIQDAEIVQDDNEELF
ncbi:MAG: hypothetical protein EKK57_03840 [Proteobacteria bacterium]|nr:MAG: hypothetical protein EKK57_03840 [Pseudomonadota bacterium]